MGTILTNPMTHLEPHGEVDGQAPFLHEHLVGGGVPELLHLQEGGLLTGLPMGDCAPPPLNSLKGPRGAGGRQLTPRSREWAPLLHPLPTPLLVLTLILDGVWGWHHGVG